MNKTRQLVLVLAGPWNDAHRLAANGRPGLYGHGRYVNAERDRWYFAPEYRAAEADGLIRLYVFGRGRNRQAYWQITDDGRASVEGDA